MHQSPRKHVGSRREKYADFGSDGEADQRMHRDSQPKARKFPLREEVRREERPGRHNPRG